MQVMQAVQESGFVSRRLFEAAYASKKAALKAGDLSGGRMGPFWDRLVFSKIKARLGGAAHRAVGARRPRTSRCLST
jgi:long-chain acyl-CoA synthetase